MQTDVRPFACFVGSLELIPTTHPPEPRKSHSLPPHVFNLQTIASFGVGDSRWYTAVGHIWSCRNQRKAQRTVGIPVATLEAWLQTFGVVPRHSNQIPSWTDFMFFLRPPRLFPTLASTASDRDDFVRVARQLLPRCVFSPEMAISKWKNFEKIR